MTEEQKRAFTRVRYFASRNLSVQMIHALDELEESLAAKTETNDDMPEFTLANSKTPEKWAFDGHPKMHKWMKHLASYGCHMNMAEWHAFCVDVHDSIRAATTPKSCECDALVNALEFYAEEEHISDCFSIDGYYEVAAERGDVAREALATHRKNKGEQ